MKNLILISALAFLAVGCAMKQKVMDVSIVSMTRTNVPEGAKLQETGPVTGMFCPEASNRGSIGLFDEAIKSAQTQSNADYITTASFFREGNCVSVEGTGQKLITAAETGSTTKK